MWRFMYDEVFPAESVWASYLAAHGEHVYPPIMERLKGVAKDLGLWNLFLPSFGGFSNVEYAPIAEISGWSPVIAPEAINCQAPDTGNMEVLEKFGTIEQRHTWLNPLLEGTIRSAFAMTEPDVASSDATNISTTVVRRGDDIVINGHKSWITGVADERCRFLIVMGLSDTDAARHRRHSLVIIPRDSPGVEIVRHLPIFGFQDQHGHSEIRFHDVCVPSSALLGGEGDGFRIAQARLGPGRIHHAMRALGMAERALALLIDRARQRSTFGERLIDRGQVRDQIAQSRMEIDQARLYVLRTAWSIDECGTAGSLGDIAGIKIVAPNVAVSVIDRAIEVFGAAGVGNDTPLAYFSAWARALRIVDGPDAVHRRTITRIELTKERPG
jgi:acyl-CoA dehydrogenase